jgi:argininosuccinate lyase
MPNKRNPDVLELIRAKMARVIAASNEGMHLVRVVVPSYGTDLHELKRTLLTSFNSLRDSLIILSPFINGLNANTNVANAMLSQGHIFATDITNLLAGEGMNFREAYKKTADWVEKAKKENKQVHEVLDEATRKKLAVLLLSKNIQLP